MSKQAKPEESVRKAKRKSRANAPVSVQLPRQHEAAPQEAPLKTGKSRAELWIYLFLLIATFAVYFQVRDFGLVEFDDSRFVTNAEVRGGVTAQAVKWAFVSGKDVDWYPLTRISHMLDWQLWASKFGLHHLTNVLFHALAALLLFAFLNRATHARWPSAFVALLFALHPQHVESVAWVSERKDVLSGFFCFLVLWAYVRYAERRTFGRYAQVVVLCVCGLLAKSMLVTLPAVMLLLDIWPLRRVSLKGWITSKPNPPIEEIPWSHALLEKVPLFAISAAASIAGYLIQKQGGAVSEFSGIPFGGRVDNMFISYIMYGVKMFWPTGLAALYPYSPKLSASSAFLDCLPILAISFFVFRSFRNFPYLTVGWLWYLGTLVPVIGLIQSGPQARADRYMYIPMVGLGIMLAWGASDILKRWPQAKWTVAALAVAACCAMAALTWAQTGYWKDTEALAGHAVEVTEDNYMMDMKLGEAIMDSPGRLPESVRHLEAAVRVNPSSTEAQDELGLALSKTPGRLPEAIEHLRLAAKANPYLADVQNNLGEVLLSAVGTNPDLYPEAIAHLEMALRLAPGYADAHSNLGAALLMRGHFAEAIPHLQAALATKSNSAEVQYNLGAALSYVPGRLPEAISHLEAAMRIHPDPDTRAMLEKLRASQQK